MLDPGLSWEYLEDGEEVGELDMSRIEKFVLQDTPTTLEKSSAGSHCKDVVLV